MYSGQNNFLGNIDQTLSDATGVLENHIEL